MLISKISPNSQWNLDYSAHFVYSIEAFTVRMPWVLNLARISNLRSLERNFPPQVTVLFSQFRPALGWWKETEFSHGIRHYRILRDRTGNIDKYQRWQRVSPVGRRPSTVPIAPFDTYQSRKVHVWPDYPFSPVKIFQERTTDRSFPLHHQHQSSIAKIPLSNLPGVRIISYIFSSKTYLPWGQLI